MRTSRRYPLDRGEKIGCNICFFKLFQHFAISDLASRGILYFIMLRDSTLSIKSCLSTCTSSVLGFTGSWLEKALTGRRKRSQTADAVWIVSTTTWTLSKYPVSLQTRGHCNSNAVKLKNFVTWLSSSSLQCQGKYLEKSFFSS